MTRNEVYGCVQMVIAQVWLASDNKYALIPAIVAMFFSLKNFINELRK